MYKNKEKFLKDYFDPDIRTHKWVYLGQLCGGLLDLEDDQLYKNASFFLDKHLLSEPEYQEFTRIVQSHFTREIQQSINEIIPYKVSLKWFKYIFKDIWWEIWNTNNYTEWQELLGNLWEKNVYMLEDDYTMGKYPLGFNFKLPVWMPWRDFYEWNYIIASLLYETYYSYFMLGRNGNWLRYIEMDGHWETTHNSTEEYFCEDYLWLNVLNSTIEDCLKRLGYSLVSWTSRE